ncbi:hypothetical protein ACKKBG_A23965 [Auxenochlorella protothecoides x Auxenochlorella symbiontica]
MTEEPDQGFGWIQQNSKGRKQAASRQSLGRVSEEPRRARGGGRGRSSGRGIREAAPFTAPRGTTARDGPPGRHHPVPVLNAQALAVRPGVRGAQHAGPSSSPPGHGSWAAVLSPRASGSDQSAGLASPRDGDCIPAPGQDSASSPMRSLGTLPGSGRPCQTPAGVLGGSGERPSLSPTSLSALKGGVRADPTCTPTSWASLLSGGAATGPVAAEAAPAQPAKPALPAPLAEPKAADADRATEPKGPDSGQLGAVVQQTAMLHLAQVGVDSHDESLDSHGAAPSLHQQEETSQARGPREYLAQPNNDQPAKSPVPPMAPPPASLATMNSNDPTYPPRPPPPAWHVSGGSSPNAGRGAAVGPAGFVYQGPVGPGAPSHCQHAGAPAILYPGPPPMYNLPIVPGPVAFIPPPPGVLPWDPHHPVPGPSATGRHRGPGLGAVKGGGAAAPASQPILPGAHPERAATGAGTAPKNGAPQEVPASSQPPPMDAAIDSPRAASSTGPPAADAAIVGPGSEEDGAAKEPRAAEGAEPITASRAASGAAGSSDDPTPQLGPGSHPPVVQQGPPKSWAELAAAAGRRPGRARPRPSSHATTCAAAQPTPHQAAPAPGAGNEQSSRPAGEATTPRTVPVEAEPGHEAAAPAIERTGPTPSDAGADHPAQATGSKLLAASTRLQQLFASSDWVASAATRYEPRGLLNPGNLCFASATVQALLASPAFCSLLSGLAREGAESLPRSVYPTLAALAELAGELQPLGREGKPGTSARSPPGPTLVGRKLAPPPPPAGGKPPSRGETGAASLLAGGAPFAPGMLADIVAVFAPLNCTGGDQRREQQDAQEFLTFLVDSMHAELSALAETRGWSRCEAEPGGSARGEDDGEEWLTRSGKRNVRRGESGVMGGASPATALFQGRIASFVAASGAPASVTLQPFCALGLHILRPGIQSVVDALEDLTAAETVAGYRPFPGSQPVSATKTLRLQTLPYLLTLHLMRFEFGGSAGDGANKVGKRVSFEPYITIKGQWLTSDSGDHGALYKLIATVSHRGAESSSGHYTADVLHPSGRWLRFDDGDVLGVSSQQVFTDRPYLLLYQRLTEEDKAAVARRR